jgi:hypothetical protein
MYDDMCVCVCTHTHTHAHTHTHTQLHQARKDGISGDVVNYERQLKEIDAECRYYVLNCYKLQSSKLLAAT